MTTFSIAGATALSLLLAGPAMAAGSYATHGVYQEQDGRVVHRMPAQDFDNFVFGIARPTYPTGWGGPYGDGEYPGTIDANMGPPYWGRR